MVLKKNTLHGKNNFILLFVIILIFFSLTLSSKSKNNLEGTYTDIKILDKIANQSSTIISFSGKFSMEEEIQLMSHLKLMISMDSSNAHMAAMMGVKVITLWGVTHPFAGFMPFNQPFGNCLLSDRSSFPLIPTSIYGNVYPKNYENAIASIPESEVLKAVKNNI